jgi:hypothetical protein
MAKFRCVGTTETNQNYIREEIKMKLNSGNPFYYSVQKLFVFSFSMQENPNN